MINACVEVEEMIDKNNSSLEQPEPSDKKVAKKATRFGEAGEDDLNNLVESAQAKATKKTTKWAISVFKG